VAKLEKGDHTVETNIPTEITQLQHHGYKLVETDTTTKPATTGDEKPADTADDKADDKKPATTKASNKPATKTETKK